MGKLHIMAPFIWSGPKPSTICVIDQIYGLLYQTDVGQGYLLNSHYYATIISCNFPKRPAIILPIA